MQATAQDRYTWLSRGVMRSLQFPLYGTWVPGPDYSAFKVPSVPYGVPGQEELYKEVPTDMTTLQDCGVKA